MGVTKQTLAWASIAAISFGGASALTALISNGLSSFYNYDGLDVISPAVDIAVSRDNANAVKRPAAAFAKITDARLRG